jgi:hypothetical protein
VNTAFTGPRFHFERLTRELNLNGVPIGWFDVLHLNLECRLYHDGPPVVTLLPRCPKCVLDHADCEACLSLGIADLMQFRSSRARLAIG